MSVRLSIGFDVSTSACISREDRHFGQQLEDFTLMSDSGRTLFN